MIEVFVNVEVPFLGLAQEPHCIPHVRGLPVGTRALETPGGKVYSRKKAIVRESGPD